MGLYQLGKDAKGSPLTEDLFYIHIRTQEVIQLFRDAAGFRVEYGAGGRPSNIFNLDVGPYYRPMAREDFEKTIANTQKRKSWLEGGLAALSKSEQPTVKQTPSRKDARLYLINKAIENCVKQTPSRKDAMDGEDDALGHDDDPMIL